MHNRTDGPSAAGSATSLADQRVPAGRRTWQGPCLGMLPSQATAVGRQAALARRC